jgi:zinc protease
MKNSKSKTIPAIFLLFAFCGLFSDFAYAIDVKRTVLPNGLIVLHSEKHNLPLVMVTLLVKASPLNEPENKAGLSNLTAELLTEGTKSRTSAVISEEVEFIGASLDTSVNNDYTTITLSVLKKDIHKGVELFSDILLNPVFPAAEIERKKGIIKGSLRQREEEPSFLAGRAFRKEVFGSHSYGRLLEGSVTTLDAITREDIAGFYSEYFLPNNSILSVVGDISGDDLQSMINQYLGRWKKSGLSSKSINKIDKKTERKIILIDKDLTQANILFGHRGISRDNPDYYAVMVMNYILGGGGFSSRLMHSIRDVMGLAYDVHSSFSANKEGGFFQAGVQTKNESANAVIAEIIRHIELIQKKEVTTEELFEAKAFLTGSFPRKLDTNRKIADFIALVEFYGLGTDYVEKYPAYINAVTKEDILRVSGKYLYPHEYVLVVVANQEKAGLKQSGGPE